MSKTIPDDVLAVLSAGRCEGALYYLPGQQLDRKLYDATNKVLDALGGKWARAKRAHQFMEPCEPLIESAIESATYARPADLGWFPTPRALAEEVAERADITPGVRVLEPSAGEGALVLAALHYGADVTAIELDPRRCAEHAFRHPEVSISEGDFLQAASHPIYDRVVMNPPFAKRDDVKHVLHAMRFLKPGGRLVSIMSAGVLFRTDALTVSLRDQLTSVEALPDGSFKSSGTSVRTALVTYDKPTT